MTGYQEVFTDPSYYGQVLIMNNVHIGNYGVSLEDVESDGIKIKGLIGRNLLTFTDYSGYDPEVSGLDGDPFQVRIDWFQYPQFRTFTGVVEIAF